MRKGNERIESTQIISGHTRYDDSDLTEKPHSLPQGARPQSLRLLFRFEPTMRSMQPQQQANWAFYAEGSDPGGRGSGERPALLHADRYEFSGESSVKARYFSEQFTSALSYDRYLQTGTQEQKRRWTQVYEIAGLADHQQQLLGGSVREMKILVYSGIWCGDCVQQEPFIQCIAEGNTAKIDLRFIERQINSELIEELRINGGSGVPVVLFFSEDGLWCATAGDRTLHRYRALALSKLGPSCPIGIIAPEKMKWTRRSPIG